MPTGNELQQNSPGTCLAAPSAYWWGPGLLLCTFVAWLFWAAVGFPFIYLDDALYVFKNRLVMSGLSWETLKGTITSRVGSYWLPVTQISFALDRTLFGVEPAGFHRTNILLHAANVFILYTILVRWTGSIWKSLLAAALFGIHPLRVESVVWVTERKDVLSAFFMLATLGSWGEYRLRQSRGWYFLGLICLAMGCMAKSIAVVTPALLFLVDWWPLRRTWATHDLPACFRRGWEITKDKLPFCLISAVFLVVTLATSTDTRGAMQSTSLDARLGMASHVYLHYLQGMVWPVKLTFHDPETVWSGIAQGQGLRWIMLLGITLIFWVWRQRFRFGLVGWLWYVLALAPTSGLIPVAYMAPDDRFSYVPCIGLCIAGAWGLGEFAKLKILPGARASIVAISIGLLLPLVFLTRGQVGKWRDGVTLFTYVGEAERERSFAHRQLAFHYIEILKVRKSAELHFQQALAANPQSAESYYNYGVFLSEEGRNHAAIEAYSRCLDLNPNDIGARVNLIDILARGGNREAAVHHFSVLQEQKTYAPGSALDSRLKSMLFR